MAFSETLRALLLELQFESRAELLCVVVLFKFARFMRGFLKGNSLFSGTDGTEGFETTSEAFVKFSELFKMLVSVEARATVLVLGCFEVVGRSLL